MALFQRQPINLKQNLPYTISISTSTVLIVGLGNPGKEYSNTRHNIGFMALDSFAETNDFDKWVENKKFKGHVTSKNLGTVRVILFKPSTFMNLSGEAVQAIASFYQVDSKRIVVVHDELAIPFGQIRNRIGGQAAGHNGIKSIIQHIGVDFGRIRVGIKNDLSSIADTSSFVLSNFSKEERELIPQLLNEINSIITEYVFGGELPLETRKIIL
jgi:peptidyl-tRNA hydrolase, PTH1 family